MAIVQQQLATGAPALEQAGAHAAWLMLEGCIHQLDQQVVIGPHGEAEADVFVLAETGHAQAWQVAAIELVMGGEGIADEHVGLAEGNGIQGLRGRTESQQFGFGVGGEDVLGGQVVIQHAQAHAVHARGERAPLVLAGDQHRLVDGIGVGKGQAIGGGFIAIGAAEQVDVTAFERRHCRLPAGIALDLDRQLQGLADQVGVFGRQTLVVAATTGDVEGGIVRRRGAQGQLLTLLQPLLLRRCGLQPHRCRR